MSAQARYEVEVSISRLQRARAALLGPPGLSHSGVEDLVQANWASLVDQVVEDNVVEWELEAFSQGSPSGRGRS
jgi:hypothetical protein